METAEEAAARFAEETARARERMKQQRENGVSFAKLGRVVPVPIDVARDERCRDPPEGKGEAEERKGETGPPDRCEYSHLSAGKHAGTSFKGVRRRQKRRCRHREEGGLGT